jgi:hypothetical protein
MYNWMYTNFDKWNQVVKTKCWRDKFYKILRVRTLKHRTHTKWNKSLDDVHLEELLLLPDVILLKSGHIGCDHMVGALTSANAMSSYHH